MSQRQHQMEMFMRNFSGNVERLQKFTELMLIGDEESAYNYMSRDKMRRIAVVLTTKCNLKCVWCHRNEPRFADYLHKEMPFEMLEKILPGLEGFETLHYGGLGEPLLYPRLSDAIRLARKHIPNVKTTTNASLLTRERCEMLADSGLTYLEVSIDGFDAEANRRVRGVAEDTLIENIEYLSEISDIDLQINTVIASINYESLFGAIDKLKNVKNLVRMHGIPLFMTKHMKQLGIDRVGDEQVRALLEHWRGRIAELGLGLELWPDVYEATLDPVMTLKRRHNLCFTPYDDPLINVYGCLAPCGRLQNVNLDSVVDMGFDAAWNGPRMLEWRRSQLAGGYTDECMLECRMRRTAGKPSAGEAP